MATRLQKLILTLMCGTSIGLSRCHKPEVEHPPAPPPDVAADAATDGDSQPGLEPAPGPEQDKIAMYGAPLPPEQEAVPMYGVAAPETVD